MQDILKFVSKQLGNLCTNTITFDACGKEPSGRVFPRRDKSLVDYFIS